MATLDNRKVIVPNGIIMSGAIENFSAPKERRHDMTFGIGYSDNIDKAKEVIKATAAECPHLKHDKGYDIFVKELADSSVNFAFRAWTETANFWPGFFWMQENIKKAFDNEGLNIPFPQMDVHVHNQ